MTDFAPTNDVEQALVAAQTGEITEVDMINVFLAGEVVVLLNQAPGAEGDLGEAQPLALVMDDGKDGIVLFTSVERVAKDIDGYTHPLTVQMSWLVQAVSEEVGLFVNPGLEFGFELTAAGFAEMRAELFGEAERVAGG